MSTLHTPLCDLLGTRSAILLAAMTGGPSTPELAGAVSRAGGLGVLGVTGLSAGATADVTRAAIAAGGGAPIGVNVQLAPPTPATGERDAIMAVLAPFRAELGLPPEPSARPRPDPPLALVEASLEAGARAVTTFEDPTEAVAPARAAGVPLLAMVTTAEEAQRAVAAGADGVIAQGGEAGGHRSAFVGAAVPERVAQVGTIALVPQVADAVGPEIPVIASGGIMDGRGIAAALALGAQGVSLGTRFLIARECGIPDIYREALARTPDDGTVVTDLVTGRPARWIRNRLVDALVEADAGTLGWGAQTALVADLRAEAARQNRADILPMLAGQGAGLVGEPLPAAAIFEQLVRETAAAQGR